MASNSIRDFSLDVSTTMVDAVSVRSHLTLRNACIDYRDANGSRWVKNAMPEASAAISAEQIPCLNKFDNVIGHMVKNRTICFDMIEATDAMDMFEILADKLEVTFSTGRLWAIPGTTEYKLTKQGWYCRSGDVTSSQIEMLETLSSFPASPLSASITHAAMEYDHYNDERSHYNNIFLYPHNAAISTGLIGSLADNQCIDMSPGEDPNVANTDNRQYMSEYTGFICAGHTSHSGEAGRIRRVTCDIRVRILRRKLIDDMRNAIIYAFDRVNHNTIGSERDWKIYCMGIYSNISIRELTLICSVHRIMSLSDATTFSIHINKASRCVIISISSGTLVKLCSNGHWADNVEVYSSDKCIKSCIRPTIDTTGPDQMRACFSAFFNFHAYINQNRAPRPLIASVQTPQAICMPWCTGNAAVSPCNTFKPVITSEFYASILNDAQNDSSDISSYLPGENVMCLFLNLEYTYEDSIMVSKNYVDNGGFNTISMCSYNISRNEYIPPVGSVLCGILSKWWKSPCQRGCSHNAEELSRTKRYAVGYKPTGVVHSITEMNNGDINVRVKSHQGLQNGDKLSMPHGQKGVATIVEYNNMPIAYNEKHGQIVPDIVMAMSSVVTRQTNGVLYEAAKSLSVLSDCRSLPHAIRYNELPEVDDEFTVVSGETGQTYTTLVYDKHMQLRCIPCKASLGMVRVFNQTQMSRERHQVSHIKPSKNSLRTPDGRARGGGVAWGEMEVQSASSAGLHSCDDEIVSRGDSIVCKWCVVCQRLGLLCTCTTEDNHITARAPYDLIATDCINSIIHNGSFQYRFEPE